MPAEPAAQAAEFGEDTDILQSLQGTPVFTEKRQHAYAEYTERRHCIRNCIEFLIMQCLRNLILPAYLSVCVCVKDRTREGEIVKEREREQVSLSVLLCTCVLDLFRSCFTRCSRCSRFSRHCFSLAIHTPVDRAFFTTTTLCFL